jgi:hypothetical protein
VNCHIIRTVLETGKQRTSLIQVGAAVVGGSVLLTGGRARCVVYVEAVWRLSSVFL